MRIFSSGYTIYNSETDARTTIINRLNSYRTDCLRWSDYVSEIQEKLKKEKQGIRHIFYFHYGDSANNKLSITSFSYLERKIGVDKLSNL